MEKAKLRKKFRLVWNSSNKIIVNGEFSENTVTGCLKEFSFEADSQEELDLKIIELELTNPNQQ